MYFVDREKIEEILSYMETIQEEMIGRTYENFMDRLLLERITHLHIEAIIDVGNKMIDGFIMRDPGSYEDIIDILTDEQVLSDVDEKAYKPFIKLRKMIIQQYTEVDHSQIETVWEAHGDTIKAFPEKIRHYLDNELGPVSAFSKS
ncbi:DUF86 domain-containing protein [Halobacillus karajensis]|uniref:DUF86 domain-containing protein n=1 Tax=Halobacillus karajensis TaxID=195088 RepID=A0A024P9M3_9BACI|nr:DUF86 domain-containing protein [Halobacillus karajensis]CDQ21290.1 hypothetical protein BN982_03657 [Halobacillus karajensis]CDQ25640.1 hypothetical protein BN983_03996 [Halobacillus karajensis]CDQ25911.1 hypothetical protein BN981_00117 [Halobacillus karajensis]